MSDIPFSLSQRDVWLDQCAWPNSPHLIIGGGGFLVGQINIDLLQAALEILATSNEALRLAPRQDGSQQLLDDFRPVLAIVDLSHTDDPRAAMRAWWNDSLNKPFTLDGTPPWRFSLLRASDTFHGWTIQFHHLVMDGWGTSQVIQRWAAIYSALVAGHAPPVVESPGYLEFIEESNAYRHSGAFLKDAEYWQSRLINLPPPLIEQAGQLTTTAGLPKAALVVQHIARTTYDAIESFARDHHASAFNLFLAAIAIYFARITGRTEILIGVPSLNRGGKRFRSTFGMFVSVFPIAISVSKAATPLEVLASIGSSMRSALRHARYPLSELGKSLKAGRDSREEPFDILLSFERQDYDVSFGNAKNIDTRQLFTGVARFPLSITVCDFQSEQDIEMILEVSTACINATDRALLGNRLINLLSALIATPDTALDQLPVLPEEERWALVEGLHQRIAEHDNVHSFIGQFEHQAALHPEATALVWDGGHMSYSDLDTKATAVARQLRHCGADRDRVIAIALTRSPLMMIALLASAKAGAAFLPLDPDAPTGRVGEILEESQALVLIIQEAHQERYRAVGTPLFCIDAKQPDDVAPDAWARPALCDLAYVLFTSGSTGRPKGVMVEHGAFARRLTSIANTFGFSSRDRSGQGTQTTFDPALIELFLPLIHGGSVALPPPGRLRPETLANFAIRHAVTFMAFVPTTLARFLDGLNTTTGLKLRVACCGGEVLTPALANRFIRTTGARLFNVYGPTETIIFSTAWPCEVQPADTALPVGQPTDDSRIYVLDRERRLLPMGVAGDIYLGGKAIARGYLNRPDITGDSFFPDPFRPAMRIYKTGDRGYLDTDGNLFFLGRLDRQVKLRGYRIELGEIEARLLAMEGVRQAAVKLNHRDNKDVIDAWVASDSCHVSDLRQILRKRLPDYMMPAQITIQPRLPENNSGKIDYDALTLSLPPLSEPASPSGETVSTLESSLLAIWEAVLKRSPIGIHDNFFDLGGDSLAAIDILASIEELVDFKPSLFLLTENPTIALLSSALGDRSESAKVMLPLNPASGGTPVFMAASGQGDLFRLQALAKALGNQCAVYMLQPPSIGHSRTIYEIASRYVHEIEALGAPPGYIAGFSVGGITALETARLLQQRGFPVTGLILLDTVCPGGGLLSSFFWRLLGWLANHVRLHDLTINGRRLGAMLGDPGLVAQVSAMQRYHPKPFPFPTLLVKTSAFNRWQLWLFRPWRRLIGSQIEETVVRGMHGSVFDPDNIGQLAHTLAAHCHPPSSHRR